MSVGPADEATPTEFPLWSFREDVHIDLTNESLVIYSQYDDAIIPLPTSAVVDALRRMCLGPISLSNVIRYEAEQEELSRLLDRLDHLVIRSFGIRAEQPLVSVVPLTEDARFNQGGFRADLPIRLSRFVAIKTDGKDYLLESPLSLHRVILHGGEAISLLGQLSRPIVPSAVSTDALHFETAMSYLMGAGLVIQATSHEPLRPPEFPEDTDPALMAWTPLDLMFHTRSTLGWHNLDFGAVHLTGERRSMEPVVKPPMGEPAIPLFQPEWDDLLQRDPPLAVALEATRHSRRHGDGPVTARELGEVLYRAARVRSLVRSSDEAVVTSDRPYLSSGECYELELYITLGNCPGLPRGIYHYDPLGHLLEPLQVNESMINEILRDGQYGARMMGPPSLLITFTARFRRLSWKYNGLSYALVLKNVGLLTQTLSLVTTALGLAACPIDIGDVELSRYVLGVDWRTESGVGGLIIGRPALSLPAA